MRGRERLIGSVVVAVVVLAAAWLLLVSPERAKVTNLNTQITAEQTTLAKEKANLVADEQARTAYGTDVHAVGVVDKAVPLSDEEPELIRLINKEEVGHSIKWTTTSISPGGAGASGFNTYNLSFSYTAGWSDLQSFLTDIDSLTRTNGANVGSTGRLFTVNSVSISPASANKISATVSMTAYLIPAGAALGTAGTTTTTAATP
jgi:Tfp pilus assembly protein PilO